MQVQVQLRQETVEGEMRVCWWPVSASGFAVRHGGAEQVFRHEMRFWVAHLYSGLATTGPVGDGDGLW